MEGVGEAHGGSPLYPRIDEPIHREPRHATLLSVRATFDPSRFRRRQHAPPVRAWLGRSWLWLFGWRVEGGRPDARKAVVIAYPHTTNWDLPFMLAVAYALDLDIRWLGKHTLFRAPFGWAMRRLGGISVDRRSRGNNVDAIVETLNPMEDVLVVIPPEGTRSHAGRWKSGFYWVAVGAELPIVLGFLDYSRKCGGLGEILYPTGDPETDLVKMREFYEGIDGKFPERTGAISFDDV